MTPAALTLLESIREHLESDLAENDNLLTKPPPKAGARVLEGGKIQMVVVKSSAKTVTTFIPSKSGSAKFAGKKYTYKWDGTGFKRQGKYLTLPQAKESKDAPAWKAAASELMKKYKGKDQESFHLRAYLRAIQQGNKSQATHMIKNMLPKKVGERIRQELIDLAGK